MKLLQLLMVFVVIACGKDDLYVMQTTPDSATEPVEQTIQDEIDDVVAEYNSFKDANGQSQITDGLNCTLHNTANADLDVSFGAMAYSFSLHTSFNQPNVNFAEEFNILPKELRKLYKNANFSLRCQGFFVATESKRYEFTLDSDDGSRLYINGTLLVDNEGSHAMTKKTGSVVLAKGVHAFRIDYSQSGGGDKGLILTSEGEVVGSELFYR